MKTFIASLASAAPYFQSRNYTMEIERLPKEGPDDYEKRSWRHRTHIDDDGQIIIPGKAFQHAIQEAAAHLKERIPGKGTATWTKHFERGILVPEPIVLPERRESIEGRWLLVNADGRRGGGRRVWRCFPFVRKWTGDLTVIALDDIITKDIMERVIGHAGLIIGIGQNRPQNRGDNGRFQLVEMIEAQEPWTLKKAA